MDGNINNTGQPCSTDRDGGGSERGGEGKKPTGLLRGKVKSLLRRNQIIGHLLLISYYYSEAVAVLVISFITITCWPFISYATTQT